MLQTQTCVSVRCGQCGDNPYTPDPDDLDLVGHWSTEDAALTAAAAAGWDVDGLPARLLCRDCGTVLRCEARGHEFTGWRRCRCAQLVPAHRAGPGGVCAMGLRYCVRCSVLEYHPLPEEPGVVLTCTDCDATYEPTAEDITAGRTGCPDPDCGGWVFSSALTAPATTGGAR